MDKGLIVEEGSPKDVIDNPKNERTKTFLKKCRLNFKLLIKINIIQFL